MDVVQDNSGKWMTKEEHDKWKAFAEDFNKRFIAALIWGVPLDRRSEQDLYKDTLKWAYIYLTENRLPVRKMLMVSNKDMKAYKMDGYNLVEPLEEVPYTQFDRWCRSMDL